MTVEEIIDSCIEMEGKFTCSHGITYIPAEVLIYVQSRGGTKTAIRRQHTISTVGNQFFHWLHYHSLPKCVKEQVGEKMKSMFYEMEKKQSVVTGGHFGTLSFLKEGYQIPASAARIITVTDCEFAVIKKADYEKCLKQIQIKAL